MKIKNSTRLKKNLGIYIHIPFCKAKCNYCDFYSINNDEKTVKRYVSSLLEHIKEYSAYANGYKVDTLYIGGGTPSVIGHKNLVTIIKAVKKHFEVDSNLELTVELNPESTDVKLLKKLYKAGVNRLSFGVQSSNDDNLIKLGRLHNFETAKNAVFSAKKVGFTNISVDLIYGLEGQTLEDLQYDLANFLALDTTHISTYCLKLEEGTKMFLDNPTLPDDDTVADMYDYICETLENRGFSHYEVSNFAKDGLESKHNNKYWDLSEYLGLGPAAHSFFCGSRSGYSRNLDEYINNRTLSEKEEPVPIKSRFGEYIMLKLRTKDGINVDEFYKMFGVDFHFDDKFIKTGHAEYKNGRYYLTDKGMYISNYIINELTN